VYPPLVLSRLVLLEAERLWRAGRPPTLALVADGVGYSSEDGLSRALRRGGASWSDRNSADRRRSFGRIMSAAAA
jgi:hypothetical protein